MDELRRRLAEGAQALGLGLDPRLLGGLERLDALVRRWSGRVRLVGRTDAEAMAVLHLLDSLTLLPFLEDLGAGRRLLDIGSGAGFPGLPVALARPDLRIDLVEVDRRKAAFLKTAVATLGLDRVAVHVVRAGGRADAEGLARADAVVSRAFTAPETWLPLAAAYAAPGGRVIAMMAAKAPSDEALEALGADPGLTLLRVWRGELPAGAGRRVIAAWTATGPDPE